MATMLGGTWFKRYDVTKADGTAGTATVSVSVTLPDGTVSVLAPVFTSPNHYDVLYPTTQIGRHVVTASATGLDLGSFVATWAPDIFHVDSAVTMAALVGLDEAKVRLNASKATNDAELLDFIMKASASVEARTRLWHRATITDTFRRRTIRTVYLRKAPAVSITSVVENGVTLDAGTYQLGGGNGLIKPGSSWSAGDGSLVVTYLAGETVVPLDVREGVLMLLEHMWSTQRGPVARSLSAAAAEAEYDPRSAYAWPRRVEEQLEPYIPLLGA